MEQVSQVRKSSLEVNVSLPCGWDHPSQDDVVGNGALLIIPHIVPRSRSSTDGLGKNMKFELRVLSSAALGGDGGGGTRLSLAPAALGGGAVRAVATGPFADKPKLRSVPTRSRSSNR